LLMKKKISIIVGILITLYSQAQVSSTYSDTISFELNQNKRIFLTVHIKNTPVRFFFDTGAAISLLYSSIADALQNISESDINVESTGKNDSYKIIANQEVRIGNTEIEQNTFALNDLTRLRQAMEQEFFGIIGFDLLKDHITEINFDQKKI